MAKERNPQKLVGRRQDPLIFDSSHSRFGNHHFSVSTSINIAVALLSFLFVSCPPESYMIL
jgi:hypothetical protein